MPRCPKCEDTYPGGQFCPKDGTRLVAQERDDNTPAPDPLLGTVIAERFRIVDRLGTGGMGTVYQAEHCFIKKRVALKLLRPEITSNPDALARFQREALAASTIGHENIVAIDDFGKLPDKQQVYLTMEYLDGEPLNHVIRRVLPVEQVIDIMLQTCHGLAAAHAKGIIHRDMKPENVFLVDSGTKVKILDFGIAKVTRGDTQDTNLTKTGAIFGTPNYMAPEQALGKKVDHRTDIYSMGIILYEMLAGVVPFRSDSFLAILTQHVTTEPTPPSEAADDTRTVPLELERIAMRAIAKNPDDRFQDMGEMVGALIEARRAVVGDKRLPSELRLSKIMPPSSESPTASDMEVVDLGVGNPTATAGELVAPMVGVPRRRVGLIVFMSLAFLLGAGGVSFYFLQRSPDKPDGPPSAAQPVPDAPTHVKAPAPEPKPEATPEPGKVVVFVSSVPSKATILRGGVEVGMTPRPIKVAAGELLELVLKRAGFKDREVTIKTQEGQEQVVEEVRLEPIRRRGRRLTRKPARPAPKPRRRKPVSDHGDHGDHDETESHKKESSSHVDGH
jgi:serine/threonine-protein kinase